MQDVDRKRSAGLPQAPLVVYPARRPTRGCLPESGVSGVTFFPHFTGVAVQNPGAQVPRWATELNNRSKGGGTL